MFMSNNIIYLLSDNALITAAWGRGRLSSPKINCCVTDHDAMKSAFRVLQAAKCMEWTVSFLNGFKVRRSSPKDHVDGRRSRVMSI